MKICKIVCKTEKYLFCNHSVSSKNLYTSYEFRNSGWFSIVFLDCAHIQNGRVIIKNDNL